MKRTPFFCVVVLFFSVVFFCSWGFWGHKKINEMAVYTLPSEMIGFYKINIQHISEHAVDADKRRYRKTDEGAKHYIDLDYYGDSALYKIPHSYYVAERQYGKDTLFAHGILPWNVVWVMASLTQAFRDKDEGRILYYSANLGHYIADAHVPLHTTHNYNGQLTGQHGIHGLWESRIPELFGEHYSFWVGKAQYIKKPQEEIWRIVSESFTLVDSVLRTEKELSVKYPDDQKHGLEDKGAVTVKTYSADYASEYDLLLNDMVERRLQSAILAIGSFWYTAWINAGKPPLTRTPKSESWHSIWNEEKPDSAVNARSHEN